MNQRPRPSGALVLAIIFLLTVLPSSCRKGAPSAPKIDRTLENGVETIQNHLAPYAVKSEPTDVRLEEELSIDFASAEIGEMGLADTTDFLVDAKGFIYFMHVWKTGDTIFKFSPEGRFLKSWGRKGQGPGELQFIIGACLTPEGHMIVSDHVNMKLIWFTDEGEFIKELRYPPQSRYYILYPVREDRFVGYARVFTTPEADSFDFIFYLLDGDLKELKKLDVYKYPNTLKKGRRAINHNEFFVIKSSPNRIFVGNEDRGYEILEFDDNGALLKKIRKEYEPVRVPEEVIKERKTALSGRGGTYYFPDFYLPICDFFPDDRDRLFVMTFEKGANPGEYVYDIFDSDGLFIMRKPLDILTWGDIAACGQVSRDRLYCFQDRADGFRVFKVYKLLWTERDKDGIVNGSRPR
jgi:hypothetical protein